MTYPNTPAGSTQAYVTQTFGSMNRLASVKDWFGKTTSFGYDEDDQLTRVTYPNGDTVAYTLNNTLRRTDQLSMVSKRPSHARRHPKVWITVAVGFASFAVIAVLIIEIGSIVESVPIRFVNDTRSPIILPDCGSDLTQINAGETTLVQVNSISKFCSIDSGVDGALVGCLRMPTPLTPNTLVRIFEGTLLTKVPLSLEGIDPLKPRCVT